MSWPTVSLGEVVGLRTGPFGSALHQHDYVAGGVPLINPTHIRDGRFIPDAAVAVGPDKASALREFSVEVGDVLMGRRGEMGRCAVVTETQRGWLCGTGSIIIRPTTKIDSNFLQRFLSSAATARALEGESVGTTMINLNQKILLALKLALPPLPEQRRIAAILDKADALRAKRREAIAKLDQLLQSVFLDMFGDPVTNSKGWPTHPFGDVTKSRLGKMLDKRTSQGPYMKPYLANANVQWGRIELDSLRTMNFDPEDQIEFALKYGDLLICEGGEPGRCAIWKELLPDCYYQKALHRVRCDPGYCLPEYLQWLFWFLCGSSAFNASITSATIAHLPGIKLKALRIPLPPIALQKSFAAICDSVEKMANRHSTSTRGTDGLLLSLQNHAFEGAGSP